MPSHFHQTNCDSQIDSVFSFDLIESEVESTSSSCCSVQRSHCQLLSNISSGKRILAYDLRIGGCVPGMEMEFIWPLSVQQKSIRKWIDVKPHSIHGRWFMFYSKSIMLSVHSGSLVTIAKLLNWFNLFSSPFNSRIAVECIYSFVSLRRSAVLLYSNEWKIQFKWKLCTEPHSAPNPNYNCVCKFHFYRKSRSPHIACIGLGHCASMCAH